MTETTEDRTLCAINATKSMCNHPIAYGVCGAAPGSCKEQREDRMAEAAAEQARGHNEAGDATLIGGHPDDFPLGEAQACGMDGDCEACQ